MKPKYKKLLNVVIALVVLVGLSVGIFFALKALGVTDQESLHKIISKTGAWGPIVFFLLQVLVSTLLSVVPGTNLTFLILSGIIFENIWLAIFISLAGVWVSSILMFTIGNTLGEKVAGKLIGQEELEKAQDLIDIKSKIYLPIMFVFPFFPDDGLCLAAGLTKMKYRYFIPVVLIFRSVGVLATVLTSYYSQSLYTLLGLDTFTPIQWILLVNVLLFDAYVIHKFANFIEKKIRNKKAVEETQNINSD